MNATKITEFIVNTFHDVILNSILTLNNNDYVQIKLF